MYTGKQYFIGFLLLFSTVLSSWLVLKSPSYEADDQNQANLPDAIMKNAILTRMNKETGKLQDRLQAELLVHYAKEDVTNITRPHFTMLQPNEMPWNLQADQGQAQSGIESIKLWGHVILKQEASPPNLPTTILTSAITIFPKKQYAQTDQVAKAIQPERMMQAVGMVIHFKTGVVDLLSKVQGAYKDQGNIMP